MLTYITSGNKAFIIIIIIIIWRKKNLFGPPNDELWNMTKKNLFRPPNDEVKFYGFQALQPFNPWHRACLPEQSLKAYNLTVKRRKICKNKQFYGNFKAYNF